MDNGPTIRIDCMVAVSGYGIVAHKVVDAKELNYVQMQEIITHLYREVKKNTDVKVVFSNQYRNEKTEGL